MRLVVIPAPAPLHATLPEGGYAPNTHEAAHNTCLNSILDAAIRRLAALCRTTLCASPFVQQRSSGTAHSPAHLCRAALASALHRRVIRRLAPVPAFADAARGRFFIAHGQLPAAHP